MIRTLLGWGRVVAALVLVLAAVDWVGWATGIQTLTRAYPTWPPMTPWTALWLAALASAILVQSGGPSPARVWVGRGLAATVAVIAAVVLAEYVTGRTFGLDEVWFGDAVRTMQVTLPGRPSPPTAASVLLLSVAVVLKRTNRWGFRAAWAGSLVAAMVIPFVTIVAYLFGAIARLEIAPSTGMALTTAFGLLLLGVACMLVRPAWLIARSDRLSLLRLGMILAGFPLLVGLSRRAYLGLGLRDDLALTFATATATVVLGTAAYRSSRREHALVEAGEADRTQLEAGRRLLAASADSMLDPQVLLEGVHDPAGQVVDLRYREANAAACQDMAMTRDELIGRTVLELLPGFAVSGPLAYYVRCLETGQPGALDDYSYDNEVHADSRRYDIRIAPAGDNLISLTFRDVTERFQAAQRVQEAQTLLHATVDSMLNPQSLLEAVRDREGRVVDFRYLSANLAFCSYRGWEERDIIGGSLLEAQPYLLSTGLFARYVTCVDTGESVILDDFALFNAMLGESRRFDIRVVRAGVGLISLTFGDVTERFDAAQRIADSEEKYRLLAENSSDMVTHVRDGRFAWTSPSVADVVGASPEYWVGRPVREIIPPEDAAAFAARLATLTAGGTVQDRIRVVAVDGVTHWADLHARPLYDDDGHQDGFTGALRLVDDEVAARRLAAEARTQKAKADERHRRSIDNAAVGMCLTTPDGHFEEINPALCEYFGYDEATIKKMTWQDLTAPEYLEADVVNVGKIMAGQMESYRLTKQFIHAHGHRIWGDLSVSCLRQSSGDVEWFIGQITDITDEVEQRQRYQLLAENASDIVIHLRDGIIVWISPSVEAVLGGSPDYWVGRSPVEVLPAEANAQFIAAQAELAEGRSVQQRVRFVALDGITSHWIQVLSKPFYTADGRPDGFTAAMRVIDDEVFAEQRAEHARSVQAKADQRYRRSIDNAAVGMCMVTPEGVLRDVNEAMCELFGYEAEAMNGTHWQDFTAPEFLDAEVKNMNGILEGRIDSYRMVKHYRHAAGHQIWGDLSVSGVRDDDGNLEHLVALITDVTAEVQARERLVTSEERNRELAQGLQSELTSAAKYLQSVLPADMTGQVSVSTRYLPSNTLGGDSFDFRWIDDDHMVVYLLDVSGHGVESALIAVSVHNMLRSASFTTETMLEPDRVLAALNQQFGMDQQDDNYFTIFYGVYQRSSATLRYANAGHPPALLFTGAQVSELSSQSCPVGTFDETSFTTATVPIPPGSQMLLYSDGVFELPLDDGGQWPMRDFLDMCTGLGGSPDWTLDDVIDNALAHSAGGSFTDDCCLVRLTFD